MAGDTPSGTAHPAEAPPRAPSRSLLWTIVPAVCGMPLLGLAILLLLPPLRIGLDDAPARRPVVPAQQMAATAPGPTPAMPRPEPPADEGGMQALPSPNVPLAALGAEPTEAEARPSGDRTYASSQAPAEAVAPVVAPVVAPPEAPIPLPNMGDPALGDRALDPALGDPELGDRAPGDIASSAARRRRRPRPCSPAPPPSCPRPATATPQPLTTTPRRRDRRRRRSAWPSWRRPCRRPPQHRKRRRPPRHRTGQRIWSPRPSRRWSPAAGRRWSACSWKPPPGRPISDSSGAVAHRTAGEADARPVEGVAGQAARLPRPASAPVPVPVPAGQSSSRVTTVPSAAAPSTR